MVMRKIDKKQENPGSKNISIKKDWNPSDIRYMFTANWAAFGGYD
jgi:hypothetical protein